MSCAQITTGLRTETQEGGPLHELVDDEGCIEMAFAKPPLVDPVAIVVHNAYRAKPSLPDVPFENGVVYQFISPKTGETGYYHDFRGVLAAISECFDVPFKRPSDEDKRFHFANLDAKKHNLDAIRKAVIKYTKTDDVEVEAPKKKKKRSSSTTQGHDTPDAEFCFALVDNRSTKGSAWVVAPLKVDTGITDLISSESEGSDDEDMPDAEQQEEDQAEDESRPNGGAGSKRSASGDGDASAPPPKKVRRKPITIAVENQAGSPDVALVELQEMDEEADITTEEEEVLDAGGLEHVVGETADPRMEEGVTVFTENAETSVVFTAQEKQPDMAVSAPVSPNLPVPYTRGDRELLDSLAATAAMVDIRQTQTESNLAKANAQIAELQQMLLKEREAREKTLMHLSTVMSHVTEACYSKISGEPPRAPAAPQDAQVYQEQLRILSRASDTEGVMGYLPTANPYAQGQVALSTAGYGTENIGIFDFDEDTINALLNGPSQHQPQAQPVA